MNGTITTARKVGTEDGGTVWHLSEKRSFVWTGPNGKATVIETNMVIISGDDGGTSLFAIAPTGNKSRKYSIRIRSKHSNAITMFSKLHIRVIS